MNQIMGLELRKGCRFYESLLDLTNPFPENTYSAAELLYNNPLNATRTDKTLR